MTAATAPTGWSAATQRWLERAPPSLFAGFAGLMAFGTYFAMYAFRKPFAAASFAGVAPIGILGGVDYKVALVIAQVIGYALSKFIGVKVIAELPARRRIIGILLQIGLAEAALLGFAWVPPPWNIAFLFIDGLALGMVWGMVFGFVEGRHQSDLIGAMLCASFVLSSGVVKSVGSYVMLSHIAGQFGMPAITGLIFVPVLAVSLLGLSILPPPSAADIAERVERKPMDADARRHFLRRYAPGLIALVVIYVALTVLRDFRDNFAAEVWAEVGLGGRADLFTWTELPTAILVLVTLASLILIRDNDRALIANFVLVGMGMALGAGASLAFAAHWIGPVAWMVMLGGGLYLAYTPFNGMLFDRLVAATGEAATAGFLIYVADASGYGGSVVLALMRSLQGFHLPWVRFMIDASVGTGAIGLPLLAGAAWWFRRRLAKESVQWRKVTSV